VGPVYGWRRLVPKPARVATGTRAPIAERHREPVARSTLLAWDGLVVAGTAIAIVWASSGDVGRASIGIAGIVLWIRFATRN
jgi:hypothetical protein